MTVDDGATIGLLFLRVRDRVTSLNGATRLGRSSVRRRVRALVYEDADGIWAGHAVVVCDG